MNCRKICDSSVGNRESDNGYHKIVDRQLVIFEYATDSWLAEERAGSAMMERFKELGRKLTDEEAEPCRIK